MNIKVVERGEGGDSRGPEKIVIPAVFQVFNESKRSQHFFQKRESDINTNTNLMKRWAGLFTRNEQIISLFKSGCFPPFPHVLLFLSFREGSKGQTIVEPSDILVNKSLTHASLLLWAFYERWGGGIETRLGAE